MPTTQCPPTYFVQGSGCIGYQVGTPGLPAPPLYSSADAWAGYNQWKANSAQQDAANVQNVMPKVLMIGGVAAAILLLAPGGWKVTAIVPAFAAYIAYGFRGGA